VNWLATAALACGPVSSTRTLIPEAVAAPSASSVRTLPLQTTFFTGRLARCSTLEVGGVPGETRIKRLLPGTTNRGYFGVSTTFKIEWSLETAPTRTVGAFFAISLALRLDDASASFHPTTDRTVRSFYDVSALMWGRWHGCSNLADLLLPKAGTVYGLRARGFFRDSRLGPIAFVTLSSEPRGALAGL